MFFRFIKNTISIVSFCHLFIILTYSIHFIILSQITTYAVHWVKGNPFVSTVVNTKSVETLTFWEQIDGGKQNTMTRKIFTLVPIVMCFIACIEADWDVTWTIINGVIAFAAILGKLPFMHRTRIFGINED